jgi:hypothetical protein
MDFLIRMMPMQGGHEDCNVRRGFAKDAGVRPPGSASGWKWERVVMLKDMLAGGAAGGDPHRTWPGIAASPRTFAWSRVH